MKIVLPTSTYIVIQFLLVPFMSLHKCDCSGSRYKTLCAYVMQHFGKGGGDFVAVGFLRCGCKHSKINEKINKNI